MCVGLNFAKKILMIFYQSFVILTAVQFDLILHKFQQNEFNKIIKIIQNYFL